MLSQSRRRSCPRLGPPRHRLLRHLPYYDIVLNARGFEAEAKAIRDAFNRRDVPGMFDAVTDDMVAALAFAGYDHKFVFGEGVHSSKHGTAIFPDAMRWMWRDWPIEGK